MNCVHGTLLSVLGRGVLLCGRPGTGKSQLALELLERGHALIADDAVELRPAGDTIIGAPLQPALRDFLMLASTLVINVERRFGAQAVAEATPVDLIVEHGLTTPDQPRDRQLLTARVPALTLARLPGSSAVVEAAIHDLNLKRQGYDAAADLAARQQRLATGT